MINRRIFLALSSAGVTGLIFPRLARGQPVSLASVRAAGELKIGCEAAYVPFTYRDQGKIVGYDVDLCEIFCRSLGVKANLIDTAWAGVIPSLYAKKFDIIVTSMIRTKERAERVAFSIPYAEATYAMLIRAGDASAIRNVNDLNGRVVAVKLGSVGQVLQEKVQASLKASGGQGFKEVRIFDDHPSAYVALAQNRVDTVWNSIGALAIVLKDAPGKYAIVKGLADDAWAGIAARKEDVEIVSFLDSEIRRLKANGEIYKLQEKWFGLRMTLPDAWPALA